MIKLDKRHVSDVLSADSADDLYGSLQSAIELEHSTIPPYLTATLSLKPGVNDAITELIRGITGQEMLHMCIAGNILIAIGGTPSINHPGFVPAYPGPLPMHVGGEGFEVGIAAFSKSLVTNTFMVIEEPEQPLPIRVDALAAATTDYATIGAFYAALKAKILELGDCIFDPASVSRQVLHGKWFPADWLFPITDAASAVRAIDLIVLQGEGTSKEPYESAGVLAHYYRFGEIAAGRRLVPEGTGFAYAGAAIPFDDNGVYPLKPNCRLADFEPGTQAYTRLAQFNYTYNCLLDTLHACFNGAPEKLDAAIGLMYSLRIESVALMQTPVAPGATQTVGPSFEYVKT